jgi:hypothetical protein
MRKQQETRLRKESVLRRKPLKAGDEVAGAWPRPRLLKMDERFRAAMQRERAQPKMKTPGGSPACPAQWGERPSLAFAFISAESSGFAQGGRKNGHRVHHMPTPARPCSDPATTQVLLGRLSAQC